MVAARAPWRVLLLGGASGSGKSTAAEALGRHLGVSWLQVDDLRLTLQYGGLLTPQQNPDLFYFLQLADVRAVPPEALRDRLIAIAQLMAPALRTVIGHHVATERAIVIEGDGISADLAASERNAAVRAVFLAEPDEAALRRNLLARGRGVGERTPEVEEQARAWARLAWLHNQWLDQEARRFGLPVLAPRPYDTLTERILAVVVDQ